MVAELKYTVAKTTVERSDKSLVSAKRLSLGLLAKNVKSPYDLSSCMPKLWKQVLDVSSIKDCQYNTQRTNLICDILLVPLWGDMRHKMFRELHSCPSKLRSTNINKVNKQLPIVVDCFPFGGDAKGQDYRIGTAQIYQWT